jgi:transcriptional regulator with XRE-family HTH domain
MSRWRPLEEYTPLTRVLVEYMWNHRPPLLPAQFADSMGISRQLMSRMLNQDVIPDPPALLRFARRMPMPVSELFTLAGWTTADDPVFSRDEAWQMVIGEVASASAIPAAIRDELLAHLRILHETAIAAHPATESPAPIDGDDGDEDDPA